MFVHAYRLEQIADEVQSTIDKLMDGQGNRLWPVNAERRFWSGEALIDWCSNPNAVELVFGGSKAYHYVRRAFQNGTKDDVRELVDPIGLEVSVRHKGAFSESWFECAVFDIGTIARIVSRQDPRQHVKFLPEEICRAYELGGFPYLAQKREFEIILRYEEGSQQRATVQSVDECIKGLQIV